MNENTNFPWAALLFGASLLLLQYQISCVVTPALPEEPVDSPPQESPPEVPQEYDEEGFLITPQLETLKLVWEPTGYTVIRIEVQIFKDGAVFREFESGIHIPLSEAEPHLLVYQELLEIPPGKYEIQIRLHDRTDRPPSEWSNKYKFKKDWP